MRDLDDDHRTTEAIMQLSLNDSTPIAEACFPQHLEEDRGAVEPSVC